LPASCDHWGVLDCWEDVFYTKAGWHQRVGQRFALPLGSLFWHTYFMAKSITVRRKKRGRPAREKAAAKASKLAGREIDRRSDKSAPAKERARRKRRLLKGPPEFRDIRGDLPKAKRLRARKPKPRGTYKKK
jgi:hypothetical protein